MHLQLEPVFQQRAHHEPRRFGIVRRSLRSLRPRGSLRKQFASRGPGYGGAWVLNKADGTLSHIDGRTHRIVSTSELDVTANDLAIGVLGHGSRYARSSSPRRGDR